MNVDWGDFYGGETAYPTNREKRVAHNVAVAEVCPNTLHPYTPYEVGAVQKLENAILRAFREAKL